MKFRGLNEVIKKHVSKFKIRKCLKCDEEGRWRYLCPKCIISNANADSGMMRSAEYTTNFNPTGGKS